MVSGDYLPAGLGGVELGDEAVERFEASHDRVETVAHLCGQGLASRDTLLRRRDNGGVVVDLVGERCDGGGGDAVRRGGRGGRAGDDRLGQVAADAGLIQK